ncbi:helix-turn-helix transcriptional regulator [Photobacterium leiognathi]|uniref:helix-turn-helix transcriptional regulator n=1 Tax=Photobacterium leiognathi TaxID=553611 RepID=UPI00273A3FB5|nr:helix-turn-helix domain-containing protein [Photobacterium leiognathi]
MKEKYSSIGSLHMINEKIRKMRIERGFKQEEVAKGIGVTPQTMMKWEQGKSEPKVSQLIKLAKFYGEKTITLIDEPELALHDKMKAKLNLIEQLTDDEQKILLEVLEAMVLKSQQRKIKEQFE